jgi:hypothetical protein
MRDGEAVARACEVYRLERVSADGERADQTRVGLAVIVTRWRLAVHAAQWPK